MDPMTDLTEKTIVLLKKASDFAAVAYDNDLTEVEIDGAKVSTISLELQLRTLAAKLERRIRRIERRILPRRERGGLDGKRNPAQSELQSSSPCRSPKPT